MNMWGLTPDFLDVLEEGFKEFFEKEVSNNAQENTQLNRPTKHTRLRNKIFRKYKASGYAGVEAIFERDQRNQKFIWGMYDRICGMFCRKTR